MKRKIQEARSRLDAQVREMVQWHFDPKTGCPFWLEYAERLDFDPRRQVESFDDLKQLGHFEDEWLRGGPVRRWIPKGLADRPAYVFETGGSTGVPKSRVNVEDFQRDYEIFGDNLSDETFPRGADWLMLGPTGPRRLRLAIEHLAQYRGGICFFVDLDPRWVNKLVKAQRFHEMDAYKGHVIDQALTILRAHDGIQCLFTTPKFRVNGTVRQPAYVTVIHNGVVVLNHFEILGSTGYTSAPTYEPHAEKAPISLQFHNDPVRFRNIWVREYQAAQGEQTREPFIKDGDKETTIGE